MHAGNAITEAEELEEVIVDVTVTAIAQAISVAAAGDFCFAAADVLVQTLVCDECVKRSRKCAGTSTSHAFPCLDDCATPSNALLFISLCFTGEAGKQNSQIQNRAKPEITGWKIWERKTSR